ncbi:MAG: hypothetical protein ACSLFQ_01540 [Thermoanaerobaculia bacterium]
MPRQLESEKPNSAPRRASRKPKLEIRTIVEETIPHAKDTLAALEKAGENVDHFAAIGFVCSADVARRFGFVAPLEMVAQCWTGKLADVPSIAEELGEWSGGERAAEGSITWELFIRYSVEMRWGHAAVDEALATFECLDPRGTGSIEWLRPAATKPETVTIRLPRYLLDHLESGDVEELDPSLRETDPDRWAAELDRYLAEQLLFGTFDSVNRGHYYRDAIAAAGHASSSIATKADIPPDGVRLVKTVVPPFRFVSYAEDEAPTAHRGVSWAKVDLHDDGNPVLFFTLYRETERQFVRDLAAAIATETPKDVCHLLHLHPGKPADAKAFLSDLCDVLEDKAAAAAIRKAFDAYGFFSWNPATGKYDLQINPATGKPLSA